MIETAYHIMVCFLFILLTLSTVTPMNSIYDNKCILHVFFIIFSHHFDFSQISYFASSFYYLLTALNKSDAKDTDIEKICDTMVNSLFSFLVTLGMNIFTFEFFFNLLTLFVPMT